MHWVFTNYRKAANTFLNNSLPRLIHPFKFKLSTAYIILNALIASNWSVCIRKSRAIQQINQSFSKFTWLPNLHALSTDQQLCQMLDGSNYKGFQKTRTTEYCPKAVCTFENTQCKIKIRFFHDTKVRWCRPTKWK